METDSVTPLQTPNLTDQLAALTEQQSQLPVPRENKKQKAALQSIISSVFEFIWFLIPNMGFWRCYCLLVFILWKHIILVLHSAPFYATNTLRGQPWFCFQPVLPSNDDHSSASNCLTGTVLLYSGNRVRHQDRANRTKSKQKQVALQLYDPDPRLYSNINSVLDVEPLLSRLFLFPWSLWADSTQPPIPGSPCSPNSLKHALKS